MAEFRIGEHMYRVMDYKEYKRIIYEPGRVTRIILNRPRYRNALSHPLLAELENAFDRAAADPECRVIVLSGASGTFSSGDDAIGLTPESAPMMADERTPEQLMKDYGSEHEVWNYYQDEHFWLVRGLDGKLRQILKPTIAMVQGYCIFRAFLLAQAMDIIFATEDALFLPIGIGEAQWEMGPRKMLEVAYEHRFLTGREMLENHMVNRVYPTSEILEKETLAFAQRVAESPASQLRRTKQAIYHVTDLPGYSAPFQQLMLEGLARGGSASRPLREEVREVAHPERHDGRGVARTPSALINLKTKLEGEGKEVPKVVLDALARAAARAEEDKARWQKAVTQEWREKDHVKRAEVDAQAYEKAMKAKEKKKEK